MLLPSTPSSFCTGDAWKCALYSLTYVCSEAEFMRLASTLPTASHARSTAHTHLLHTQHCALCICIAHRMPSISHAPLLLHQSQCLLLVSCGCCKLRICAREHVCLCLSVCACVLSAMPPCCCISTSACCLSPAAAANDYMCELVNGSTGSNEHKTHTQMQGAVLTQKTVKTTVSRSLTSVSILLLPFLCLLM